jgi:hypothetical protein
MNEQLTKKLWAKYPLLYEDKNASIQNSLIPFGFECGNGWYDLIDELSFELEKEIRDYKSKYPDLHCEACYCPREEHYGCESACPGKCLAVRKIPTKYKYKRKIFYFRPKWLSKALTFLFSVRHAAQNKILELFFFKYQICHCEQYRHPHPRASQVKSKFATLRFYMTCATQKMYDLISEAEKKSAVTCEECGQPGTLRGGGWLETLCDKCVEERKKQ